MVTVFAPPTVTEMADLLRSSASRFVPCGARSKIHWGSPRSAPYLSTVNLNQVIAYAPSDLTITLEAGMRFADLQTILASQGQFWPVDPLYPDQATVGGIIATADTGSLRHRYGGLRDLVLGITFLRADGALAKAGGRVVKNVAGYDLMKLLTGSRGQLAVITQVTLRLYPLPRSPSQDCWTGDLTQVGSLADQVLQSTLTPVAVDILSPALLQGDAWGIQIAWQGAESEPQRVTLSQWAAPLSPSPPRLDFASPWAEQPVFCKFGLLPAAGISILGTFAETYPQAKLQWHRRSGLGRLGMPAWDAEGILTWRQQFQQAGGFLQVLAAPPPLMMSLDPDGIPMAQRQIETRLQRLWDPQGRFA